MSIRGRTRSEAVPEFPQWHTRWAPGNRPASTDGTRYAGRASMGRYLPLLVIGTLTLAGCGNGSAACECAEPSRFPPMPLECACGSNSGVACPSRIDDYQTVATALCAWTTVTRVTGCGKVAFTHWAYAGSAPTFDAQSGALIGLYVFSDTGVPPCDMALGIRYGEQLFDDMSPMPTSSICPSVEACTFCGSPSPDIPFCN